MNIIEHLSISTRGVEDLDRLVAPLRLDERRADVDQIANTFLVVLYLSRGLGRS